MSGIRHYAEGMGEIRHLDGGKVECHATFTCCHCNRVWREIKGSGVKRGFCLRCCQRTCGSPGCDECVPIERRLECMEKGAFITPSPVSVSVPASVIRGGVILGGKPRATGKH